MRSLTSGRSIAGRGNNHHAHTPVLPQRGPWADTRPARGSIKVAAGGFSFGSCPYSTLGVQANASDETIKTAYRKLVLQYHPDVNHASGAELKFMSIQQAYELLTNKARGGEGTSGRRSDWAFHDWYWSFMQKRRWGGYKRGSAAAAAAAAAAGEAGPGHQQQQQQQGPAFHQQPQHQAAIRTQLAGLRHRAAIRANSKGQRRGAAAAAAATAAAASEEGGDAGPQQQPAEPLEYDSTEMGDGSNMASGVTNWEATAEAHAAASAAKRFSATNSHREQVMGQVAGLHRRAAASQEAAGGLW